MKLSSLRPIALWVSLLLMLGWSAVRAQAPQNLLTNPGFNDPFVDAGGDPPRQVAQGWTPWHIPAAPGMSTSQNIQPDYAAAAPDTARIREGNNAQMYSSFFATHSGGVLQRVTGVTAGAQLEFSIFIYVWSSVLGDVNISEQDGDVLVRVGIDPRGGTDGQSADIVWSQSVEQYDAYNRYVVTTAAAGNAVTVFVESTVGLPIQNNFIYLDSAALVVVNGSTASATPADGGIIPTATTDLGATATTLVLTLNAPPKATDTPAAPTNTVPAPTNFPTLPVTATQTPVPASATPLPPSATPLPPTPTPEAPTLMPTATEPLPTLAVLPTATGNGTGGPLPVGGFPNTIIHAVRRGDTVSELAALYGSTTAAIIAANGLDDTALILIGQNVVVPVPLPPVQTATPTTSPAPVVVTATVPGAPPATSNPGTGGGNVSTVYVVQPGDTLLRIAARFSTTPAAIAQLNGIVNPNRIRVGQRLVVPGTGGALGFPTPFPTVPPVPVIVITATMPPAPTQDPAVTAQPTPASGMRTYTVQPGDTLFRISVRFGVPIQQLIELNNITNANRIFIGQVLSLP